MRVSLANHWLVMEGGAELVLRDLIKIFSPFEILTLFHDPEKFSFPGIKIRSSLLNRFPLSQTQYRKLLPLYPYALKKLKVDQKSDLLISSDAALIKGVQVPKNVKHICYCHSPARYLWVMPEAYIKNKLLASIFSKTSQYLRDFDYEAAQKVDLFIGNSKTVVKRIREHYARKAELVYPAVPSEHFLFSEEKQDYYFIYGRHVPYKRFDLAIQACERLGKKLIVAGEGPLVKKHQKISKKSTTQFVGRVPFEKLREYLAHAKAMLFPGEEDFGITPIEAMASGTPVIAYSQGGVTETVLDQKTGIFFDQQSVTSLAEAIEIFENISHELSPSDCQKQAQIFNFETFEKRMKELVAKVYET